MPVDPSSITDYAWADIAKAAKACMLNSAMAGFKYKMPDGRELQRMSFTEAKALYEMAMAQIAADSAGTNGAGIVLAEFGDS